MFTAMPMKKESLMKHVITIKQKIKVVHHSINVELAHGLRNAMLCRIIHDGRRNNMVCLSEADVLPLLFSLLRY